MKKIFAYLTVIAAIVAAGCTNFGDENQLMLDAAPDVVISNVIAEVEGDSITFTVAPTAEAGYYSWVVVKSEVVDTTLQSDYVLKKLIIGEASGLINYEENTTMTVGVGGLTPFTVYQIYAVASSKDGIVSLVSNSSIRTLDDGSKPTPQTFDIADTIVTLSFHEPLQLGSGKVFVSYFAKNTVSGDNPLLVDAGFEDFNEQDIEIGTSRLSVEGSDLIVKLPNAASGVYASLTYEEGAVTDLDGNLCSAYMKKADTLISGVPSRRITVRVPTKDFALQNEFEEINPDTVVTFSDWTTLMISAIVPEGTIMNQSIKTAEPTVVYNEPTKTTTVLVDNWGLASGVPAFMLPEAPGFGAIVDLNIPAGSFEDVYGNSNLALDVEDYYLYSYGYELEDVIGTYDIAMTSNWDGALSETGIIIDKAADSDTLLIKNLHEEGSVIKGVFDPVFGTITVADEQLLVADVDFGDNGIHSIYFVNGEASAPVVLNVPTAGKMLSTSVWGYYILPLDTWYDAFTSSTWTRTSTDVVAPEGAKAKAKSSVVLQTRRNLKK